MQRFKWLFCGAIVTSSGYHVNLNSWCLMQPLQDMLEKKAVVVGIHFWEIVIHLAFVLK